MTRDTQALRDLAAIIEDSSATMAEHGEIPAELRAAADTIDALRRDVDTLMREKIMESAEARANVARLRELNRRAEDENDDLRRELARLRAAIEEMVEDVDTYSNDSKVIRSVSRIARAALGEGTS